MAPAATINGQIGGTIAGTLKPIMFELSENGRVRTIVVVVTEADNACDAIKTNKGFKSAASIWMKLKNGKGDTLKSGSYGVNTDQFPNVQVNYSQGNISRTNGTCTETLTPTDAAFGGGSVELTEYDEGTSVKGTFNITAGGQTLTGSFAANACAGVTQQMLDDADTCP